MADELLKQSNDRNGAQVLWITIHTAEGATDEFPARPDLDAGSARDLLKFFQGKTDRSCHAVCDDDVVLDGLVPYDRAAWTLRDGNRYSDNLEMCGLASWTRAEWLQHIPMVDIAARWAAGRCKARGIQPVRLSTAQVAGRKARGVIDHNTYTQATHDGTHWDVGPDFPWDHFMSSVQAHYLGTTTPEDDVTPAQMAEIKKDTHDTVLRAVLAGLTGDENQEYRVAELKGWGPLSVRGQLAAVNAKLDKILGGAA
jgi:hypothetical protein